jgi:hypothetical protein
MMPRSHFVPDSRARTVLGWTPGLHTLLGGRVLSCGCLAGTYHAWNNQVVVILDDRFDGCVNERHKRHAVLWASTSVANKVASEYDDVSAGSRLA